MSASPVRFSKPQLQIAPVEATHAVARLVVVIPAFNEEGNIPKVAAELSALKLDGVDVDFVVIDDGSHDRTREVARQCGATVVSLPYNMGIGIAVQTGFRYALSRGADFVVQVDGDGQHIPTEISKLLEPIRQGRADVVIGSRFAGTLLGKDTAQGIRSTTLTRWLVGRALSLNIRALTGLRITDTTSGFRLYSKKAAQYIARHYPDDYPEVQVLVPLSRRGFRVVEVPVLMRPRQSGQSSINWHRAIYYVFKVVLASLLDRVRPST